ncbi:MAG TPA: DUF3369 domain-containing protein [Solimonas sp.]|nr:DUF3369 domain-containing protein [Solimonas sp.]
MTDELNLVEDPAGASPQLPPWLLLIVDDDREVHAVTELALRGFSFGGRPFRFLHAYSGREAIQLLDRHRDIVLVLLDVVMESERAGLAVVEHVRNVLHDRFTRIVLRTGQPGQAPELQVITHYDINDYRSKTELTRERLCTTVYTSLSTYRDLVALDANRRGLEQVIEASARIFELRSMDMFVQGVLEQLAALLFLDHDAVMVRGRGIAAGGETELRILAAIGAWSESVGRPAREVLPPEVMARVEEAQRRREPLFGSDYVVGYQDGAEQLLFYVSADHAIDPGDRRLIELFYRNVGIARETVRLLAAAQGR